MINMSDKITLKYPVIFVHGIIAHDRKSFINFWGRIPEILINMGNKVFFGNTDAWGDCRSNALILKNTIENVLKETNSERVNIISHSKGGIDSRYLIWRHDFGDKIASLTTICTPHNGAEIADLLFSKKITHTRFFKKVLLMFGKMYGDIKPNLFNVNYQLTTFKMKEFNEKVIMDTRVFYQNFYISMKNAFDDFMFHSTYKYINKISGKNDGLVSEKSADWGVNSFKIEGGISHAEILDYKKKKISGKNIPDIYINMIRELSGKGF